MSRTLNSFSLVGAINLSSLINIKPDIDFFESKFHLFLPAPALPLNPAYLGIQLSHGLVLSHLGHYSLRPTAVLDPEWHHKGQHPFWIRVR